MTERLRLGCYPGSFAPLTAAHLAVAEAALAVGALDRVDLVLSLDALGRGDDALPDVHDRVAVLREVAARRPWLGVELRSERLIAELAAGYDAVVLGADKWRQVLDPRWYGDDPSARDEAVAGLPLVLVAPRADDDLADARAAAGHGTGRSMPEVRVLPVHDDHRAVSATAVRAGHPGTADWVADDPAVRAAAARWFAAVGRGGAGRSDRSPR